MTGINRLTLAQCNRCNRMQQRLHCFACFNERCLLSRLSFFWISFSLSFFVLKMTVIQNNRLTLVENDWANVSWLLIDLSKAKAALSNFPPNCCPTFSQVGPVLSEKLVRPFWKTKENWETPVSWRLTLAENDWDCRYSRASVGLDWFWIRSKKEKIQKDPSQLFRQDRSSPLPLPFLSPKIWK